jgi:hypothetical protein
VLGEPLVLNNKQPRGMYRALYGSARWLSGGTCIFPSNRIIVLVFMGCRGFCNLIGVALGEGGIMIT